VLLMNLGTVAMSVAVEIAFYVAVVLMFATIAIRRRWGVRKRVLIPLVLFLAFPATTYVCWMFFFQPLFTHRHWMQNDKIPEIDYVSYRPDVTGLLRAVGPISEPALEQWVAARTDLKLKEVSPLEPVFHDVATFGVGAFQRQFTTDSNSRGGRYRLYWKNGNVYVAYNSF